MSDNDLAPISWASSIIGFISFAFTLSTFFKVIAGNLDTLSAAPQEVPYYLSNLKQELFEERLHLRRARRRAERNMRHHRRSGLGLSTWDSSPAIRLIEATVRRLCREFRELERPFLVDRGDRGAGGGTGAAGANTLEEGVKEREKDVWDDYMDGGFEHDYGTVTFYHRFAWLMRKTKVQALGLSLERLQVRRIARETTDALNEMKRLKTDLQDLRLIPGGHDGGGGGGGGNGGGGGRAPPSRRMSRVRVGGERSGHRREARSRDRGRSASSSASSISSGDDVANEKRERVHVRRTSRYRVQ